MMRPPPVASGVAGSWVGSRGLSAAVMAASPTARRNTSAHAASPGSPSTACAISTQLPHANRRVNSLHGDAPSCAGRRGQRLALEGAPRARPRTAPPFAGGVGDWATIKPTPVELRLIIVALSQLEETHRPWATPCPSAKGRYKKTRVRLHPPRATRISAEHCGAFALSFFSVVSLHSRLARTAEPPLFTSSLRFAGAGAFRRIACVAAIVDAEACAAILSCSRD